MKCRSIRVRMDKADDGRDIVLLSVGNMRRGGVDTVAWVEMPPGMAESIASDLRVVAADVRQLQKPKGK